jgi:hypothetical protein
VSRWWNLNVAPPCCDECSFESVEAERRVYSEFVKRFPESALREEAERRLRFAPRSDNDGARRHGVRAQPHGKRNSARQAMRLTGCTLRSPRRMTGR